MIDFTTMIATAQQEQRTLEQQMSEYQQALAQLEQRRLVGIGRLQTLIELDNEQRTARERVAADAIEKQRIIAEQRILHDQVLQAEQRAIAESEQEPNEQSNQAIDRMSLGVGRAELFDRVGAS